MQRQDLTRTPAGGFGGGFERRWRETHHRAHLALVQHLRLHRRLTVLGELFGGGRGLDGVGRRRVNGGGRLLGLAEHAQQGSGFARFLRWRRQVGYFHLASPVFKEDLHFFDRVGLLFEVFQQT